MDSWRTYTEIKYLLDRGLLEGEEERVVRGVRGRAFGVY